jgi:hypothetical protein
VEHRFGHTFGDVGDQALQRQILMDMLKSTLKIVQPGTIHTLPYRWAKDDLRERQLQKKAH